jgi:hypothetical protein
MLTAKIRIIGYVLDNSANQEIEKVLGNLPADVRSFFNEVIFLPNFIEPNKNFDNSLRNLFLSRIDKAFPINSTKIIVYDRIVYLMGVITGTETEYLKKLHQLRLMEDKSVHILMLFHRLRQFIFINIPPGVAR